MATRLNGEALRWYRCAVSKADMAKLNQRSDVLGFLQSTGFLLVLASTGTAVFLAAGRLPWWMVAGLLLLHGTCWNFLVQGFHELVHDTVFKTKWLNRFFLGIYSFLGQFNPAWFWASHTEHHKFTLHQPDDLEVTNPQKYTRTNLLLTGIVNPKGLLFGFRLNLRLACGRLEGPWDHHLFDNNPEGKADVVRWARIVLFGHTAILAASIALHLWMIPVIVCLAPYYGNAGQNLCNTTQHIGLRDAVPDHRLCCRTIYMNPFLQFIYWHMNYHIEHHMFAAVPCYRLGRLHRLIKADLPPTTRGVIRTWREIFRILDRQAREPGFVYEPPLPSGVKPKAITTASDESAEPAPSAQSPIAAAV